MHFTSVENAELGKIQEPIENTTFDKLKEKSLGCLSNILFWNDQQKHVSSRIEKMEHTILMGDYGTGDPFYFKTLVVSRLNHIFTGKTLILEAAAKTLSDRNDTEVVFIMALGEKVKSQKS